MLEDQDLCPSDKMELKRVVNLLNPEVSKWLRETGDKDAIALAEYLEFANMLYTSFNSNDLSWNVKIDRLTKSTTYFTSIEEQEIVNHLHKLTKDTAMHIKSTIESILQLRTWWVNTMKESELFTTHLGTNVVENFFSIIR